MRWLPAYLLQLAIIPVFFSASARAEDPDYLRDVKPILKTHCFGCHGPLQSESGLRLDTKKLALQGGESGPAFVAGNVADSQLLKRLTAEDDSRMPAEGKPLGRTEIDILTRWIAAGAPSPADEAAEDSRAHWSFQPIHRPQLPATKDKEWNRNPIDKFITARHRQHQLDAASPVPRHLLLRRVYLDLIGLPPTRQQLQAFLDDDSPAAYARVVDQLLASPHYGERWGRHWLDIWRYSDWYGFQNEIRFSQKNIWHWRDWVIESLNGDKGYDRMVMEMLAGDEILPFDPANLRATGLLVRNRNTDSREQWIRDTIEHTSKAFFGITMACVQCHDHPYDPIMQEEYYRYRNIFEPVEVAIDNGGGGPAGVDLAGVARIFDRNRNAVTRFFIRGNDKTPDEKKEITAGIPALFGSWVDPQEVSLPPLARIPLLRKPVAAQAMARLEENLRQAEAALENVESFVAANEQRLATDSRDDSTSAEETFVLDSSEKMRVDSWLTGPGQWSVQQGTLVQQQVVAGEECWLETRQKEPSNFSLRLRFQLTDGTTRPSVGVVFSVDSKAGHGVGVFLAAGEDHPGLHFFNDSNGSRNPIDNLSRKIAIQQNTEYVLLLQVRDRLVNVYLNDVLQQSCEIPQRQPRGNIRLWTSDAAARFHHLRIEPLAENIPLVPADTIRLLFPIASLDKSDPAYQAFSDALVQQSRLKLATRQAELHSHQVTWEADTWKFLKPPAEDDEAAIEEHKLRHNELAMVAHTAQQRLDVAKAHQAQFLAGHELAGAKVRSEAGLGDDEELTKALDDATKKAASTTKQLETSKQKLAEDPVPGYRGLPGSYGSSSGRRLALARWLSAPENPLTARVAVNHIWLRHFGQALVKTTFDFGLSGDQPSHPELLNWLAAELRQPSLVLEERGGRLWWIEGSPDAEPWSMKHLHRLLVTSRTYQSSSQVRKENIEKDPDNIWLARLDPRRMDAETVRDSVLHVAGQLDTTLGGPDLPSEDGMSVKRRSIYFHQSPEVQMTFLKLFDGADPTECYQRHTSIVPHQALALFNSELALVQSRLLARQLASQFSRNDGFIETAFRQLLVRPATRTELKICRRFLEEREAIYRQQKEAVEIDEKIPATAFPSKDPRIHACENLIHSLLNHHEFVTIQ